MSVSSPVSSGRTEAKVREDTRCLCTNAADVCALRYTATVTATDTKGTTNITL